MTRPYSVLRRSKQFLAAAVRLALALEAEGIFPVTPDGELPPKPRYLHKDRIFHIGGAIRLILSTRKDYSSSPATQYGVVTIALHPAMPDAITIAEMTALADAASRVSLAVTAYSHAEMKRVRDLARERHA